MLIKKKNIFSFLPRNKVLFQEGVGKKKKKRSSKISNALFIDLSIQSGAVFFFKKENYPGTPFVHARKGRLFLQMEERRGRRVLYFPDPLKFSFIRPLVIGKRYE